MAKHGGKVVFFGRFISILRFTAAWAAGIARMPWWRFLFWNAAGGIAWATAVGLVSYYGGAAAADAIQRYGIYAAVGIAIAVLIGFFFTMWARSGWKNGSSAPDRAGARARRRARRGRLRRRLGGRDGAAGGAAVGARAGLHACRGGGVREPRGDVDRRQPRAPTFNALARRYATLTKYDGVGHPSLPNYLALVSGSAHGIRSDCTDCPVRARSLADTLAVAGKTRKTYAEDLPYPGFTGGSSGRYAKKHDPFLYFRDVAGSRRDATGSFRSPARARPRRASLPGLLARRSGPLPRCTTAPSRPGTPGSAQSSAPAQQELRGGVVFVVFDEGRPIRRRRPRRALALGPTLRQGSRRTKAKNRSAYCARSRTPGGCRASASRARERR